MDKFIAHILVVDDDDGIRSLVKKYLNENNFLVTTAKSAEDASEKINIIGGEFIYKEFLAMATRLIITKVNIVVNSPDAYFPQWKEEEWKEVSRKDSSESGIEFSFIEYLRN